MMVELFPAIDLHNGHVVRLTQGDYGNAKVYGSDPIAVARSFADAGASWIHVVDLDAARSGSPQNRPVVGAIAIALAGRVRVQTGGGVRAVADAQQLADAGVARVVMGSAAIERPELVDAAAQVVDVAVGLDHRDGEVAVHGWTVGAGVSLDEALGWFPAASAFVITDIARDGMLEGPDVEGLAAVAARSSAPVIASGGVSSLADIAVLSNVPGVAGIITGKAIYEGRFTVAEALKALRS
jgi:phosphoribosylformimino-5-aminoimidazole carboxamide ribotide isomerase